MRFISANRSGSPTGAFFKLILVTAVFYCHLAGAVEKLTDAYERLPAVDTFSLGFNGFVGHKSEGERYVDKISDDKNAEKIFISIARSPRSTPEAKLYAACGLRKIAEKNHDDLFRHSFEKQVSVLKADILRKERFYDVYSWIQQHGCH